MFKYLSNPVDKVCELYLQFENKYGCNNNEWYKHCCEYFENFGNNEIATIFGNITLLSSQKSKTEYLTQINEIINKLLGELSDSIEHQEEFEKEFIEAITKINEEFADIDKIDLETDEDILWVVHNRVVATMFKEELEKLQMNISKWFSFNIEQKIDFNEIDRMNIPWWLLKPFIIFCIDFGYLKSSDGTKINQSTAPALLKKHFVLDDGNIDNHKNNTIRRDLSSTKSENIHDNQFRKIYNKLVESVDSDRFMKI